MLCFLLAFWLVPVGSVASGISGLGNGSVAWAEGAQEEDSPGASDGDTIAVTVKVTGASAQDAEGNYSVEEWVPETAVEVDASESAVAWDALSSAMDAAGLTYEASGWYWPYSVTKGGLTLAASSSAPWDYWSLLVNGEYASYGADSQPISEGDSVELVWCYGSGQAVDAPSDVDEDPSAEIPDAEDSVWPGYSTGASAQKLPTATENGEGLWQNTLKDETWTAWGEYVSEPIVVGSRVYVAGRDKLYMFDANKGEYVNGIEPAQLAEQIDQSCRPVYINGVIVVPLHNGRLQGLAADTLKTLWVTDAITGEVSVSTLTVDGNLVYASSSQNNNPAGSGTLMCVDSRTGKVVWQTSSASSGYYWAGSLRIGGWLVIGNDAGQVLVFDATTGVEVSNLQVGASDDPEYREVRASLVSDGQGGILAVTKDGTLHKLSIDAAGALSEVSSVRFAKSSTSTPCVVDGKAVVGGVSQQGDAAGWGTINYGSLSVIDLATMTVETEVTSYDGKPLRGQYGGGDVKSLPTVVKRASGTYVYFTSNDGLGAVYCYKLGEAEATMLYQPEASLQNYGFSSVAVGPDGQLYYINDSCTLFAIKGGEPDPVEPEGPTDPETPETPGDNTGNGGQGGSASKPGSSNAGSNGSNGSNVGTGVAAGAGAGATVAAGAAATAGDNDKDDAESASASSKGADGEAAEAAEEAPTATLYTANEGAETTGSANEGDLNGAVNSTDAEKDSSLLPILGIVIGVLGLAAVIAFVVRRRSGKDE